MTLPDQGSNFGLAKKIINLPKKALLIKNFSLPSKIIERFYMYGQKQRLEALYYFCFSDMSKNFFSLLERKNDPALRTASLVKLLYDRDFRITL